MRRVLLGNRAGAYGLWVSKPGRDVVTGSADDMMLSPDYFNNQIALAGSGSYPFGSSIAHNLGYIPVVHIFGMWATYPALCTLDTTNIYFGDPDGGLSGSAYTMTCSWFIMRTRLATS